MLKKHVSPQGLRCGKGIGNKEKKAPGLAARTKDPLTKSLKHTGKGKMRCNGKNGRSQAPSPSRGPNNLRKLQYLKKKT